MKRRFNVTGSCIPERHYMVRLEERLRKIKEEFVDTGSYFVINRGRQYGKTTTLDALKTYLQEDYIVLSLDFQQIATEDFADAQSFVRAFAEVLMIWRYKRIDRAARGAASKKPEPPQGFVRKSEHDVQKQPAPGRADD